MEEEEISPSVGTVYKVFTSSLIPPALFRELSCALPAGARSSVPPPLTLPEGQEDNGFDGAELQHGIEGRQQVAGGEVEQIQPVQCQRDRDVVDDGDVNVASISTALWMVCEWWLWFGAKWERERRKKP